MCTKIGESRLRTPNLLYLIFASISSSLVCAQILVEEDKCDRVSGVLMLSINIFLVNISKANKGYLI